jgi:hypothetical protein
MRVARLFSLVSISLVLSVLSISLAAQQTVSSSPQAVSLLQKSLAALTGGQSITDITLSGTARRIAGSDDESGTGVLKAIAGAGRMDLSLSLGQRSEIEDFTGTAPAGSWSGPDGVSHTMAYHNLLTEPSWFFPALAIARRLSNSGYVFTYVGQETHNGASVIHLSAYQQVPGITGDAARLPQHLSQIEIFLDPTTLLPTSIAFNTHPDNNALLDIPIAVDFSDYRPVNSIQVPFHIQKSINNSLTLDLQFESVITNTGLSASDFNHS